jgi:ATP-binding cassette subfamily B protein
MSKKYIFIKQQDIKDCGVCCLLSIIKYYNGNVPLERLREMTNTTKLGTNAFNIIKTAEELNFNAKGVSSKLEDINNSLLPAIAHVVIDNKYKHYVVIYKIDYKKKILLIMDPNVGIKKYTFDEFNNIWTNVLILLIPNSKIPIINPKTSTTDFFVSLIKPYKKTFISIILLSFIYMIFNIFISFYFKFIIDNVLLYNSKNNLYVITLLCIFATLYKIIISYFRNNLLMYLNEKIDFPLIKDCFRHIMTLPYSYFKNKTTGEIVSRINDLSNIKDMISKALVTVFIDVPLVVFVFVIFFTLNITLAFISVLIVGLLILAFLIFKNIIKSKITLIHERGAKVNAYLIESIEGLETIKSNGNEEEIQLNMGNKYINYLSVIRNYFKIYNIQLFIKDIITYIGTLIILFVGTLLVIDGKMSLGELITFNALLIYFIEPIKGIIDLEFVIRDAFISIKRIRDLYEIDCEFLKEDNKVSNIKIKGSIKVNNLSFSYNNYEKIIDNLNIKINIGDKVLINGTSGVGKSTLFKLLMNYYSVDHNKILIDEKNINDYNLKEYRDNICYIGQNEKLFTDTIYNNIIFDREVDYNDFLTICKITKVTDFVNKNRIGYDYLLEEDGFNISGGQRQRIILARGLLKKANIILLDEALSEVDESLERIILKNIFCYFKDKTILIISHRLENKDLFDRVLKLDNYKLEECYE